MRRRRRLLALHHPVRRLQRALTSMRPTSAKLTLLLIALLVSSCARSTSSAAGHDAGPADDDASEPYADAAASQDAGPPGYDAGQRPTYNCPWSSEPFTVTGTGFDKYE